MRVLVTGAAGRIGRAFRASADAAGFEIVATDVEEAPGIVRLDVTDPGACREAVEGVDAVLHLAADPSPEADFAETVVPLNVLGTYNPAQAAVDAGVDRFVFAGSVQAIAGYPLDHQVRETDPPRPINGYGVGKAAGESLCAWLGAVSATSFVSVRIGAYNETAPDADGSVRDRMAWLSPRDAAQLFRLALTVPVAGHLVVHGISDNRHKQISIDLTRRALGYAPVDDAFRQDPPSAVS